MDLKPNLFNQPPPVFRAPNHQFLRSRKTSQRSLFPPAASQSPRKVDSPDISVFSEAEPFKEPVPPTRSKGRKPTLTINNEVPVKFHQLKLESPEGSMLLDYTGRDDFVAKSPLDSLVYSPKMMSIEEYSERLNRSQEANKISFEGIDMKKVTANSGPKIVITPAAESQRIRRMTAESPKYSFQTMLSFHPPKRTKTEMLKKKITKFFKISSKKDSPDKVGEQIHMKQMQSSKPSEAPRINSGRLLNIIADQAMHGKNHEVSRAFKAALTRVNADALYRAHSESQRKKMKYKHFFRNLRARFERSLEPWKPDSRFIIYWKVLLLLAILIQSFLSPFILCFLDGPEDTLNNGIVSIGFGVDVVYVISILLRFRTAYYHQGELRTKSSDIVFSYLKGSFIFDVLTELSLIGRLATNYNTTNSYQKYLVMLTVLRIYQIKSLITAIEDHFQFSREIKTLNELLKMCVSIFILAHWFGCLLYSVTKTEVGWPETWITEAGLQNKGVIDVYAASLYWAITTMSTVGYGDITPRTTRERMVTVVIMIFSSIVFGFLLSSIGSLLLDFSTFSSESREKMRSLNKYMHEKGLSKDIQHRIRKYLEFYLAKENALRAEGDNTIQLLSQSLKDDIIKEVNAKLLNETYMFSFNFRKRFLYLISRDFTEKSFGPDEMIFRFADHDDLSVYFVMSGKVEIFYEKCDISLHHIQKGETFGFLSFFSGKPRTASARSLEFTTVFILDRHKFQQKLEEFATEKETYLLIQDNLNHYNNYQYLNISCYSCGSVEHIALECPKVHFNYNRQKIITNHLLSHKRFRADFKRKKRIKFRALRDLEPIQEAAAQHQLIQQNELYFDNEENDENAEIRSYSTIDDILDRNIYDLQPLVYTVDTTQVQAIVINEADSLNTTNPSESALLKKRKRKKAMMKNNMGEIELFAKQNYDKYYHTLSIDRVKNFEVYNPSENITKMMVNFEKIRLQKVVENRLGVGAKHISRLLVKGFRMHERAKSPSMSSAGSLRSLETERKQRDVDNFRRVSVSVNPADIAMYNTGERKMFPKGDDSASRTKISKDPIDRLLKVPGVQPSNVETVRGAMVALHANRMERQSSRSRGLSKKKNVSIEDNIMNKNKRGSVMNNDSKRGSIMNDKRRKESIPSEASSDSDSESGSDTSSDSPSDTMDKHSKSSLLAVNRDSEKLVTASFGEEDPPRKKKKKKIIASMTQPLTFSIGPRQSAMARKSVFVPARKNILGLGSDVSTMKLDNEGTEAKKPVAMFDFTQLLKKMTTKLEENTIKSPLSPQFLSTSTISSKEVPILHRKESPSRYKKAADKKDLFMALLHQKNRGSDRKKRVRASSAENGKEIKNFIAKHHLEEILETK